MSKSYWRQERECDWGIENQRTRVQISLGTRLFTSLSLSLKITACSWVFGIQNLTSGKLVSIPWMVYKSSSKYIVVTNMVEFNQFTLVFTFWWKYFYSQASGLNLNATLVIPQITLKNLRSHACEPFRGLGPDDIANWSPALEFFSSTFFPKPRTYFYIYLKDDAARIFPSSLAATRNKLFSVQLHFFWGTLIQYAFL